MEKLILDKFDTCIKGLRDKEARIAVFEKIRDIPYYLVPQMDNPLEWASSILENNKGSCSPKHYLLGFLFGKLGIPVKYATFGFNWDKQKISYNTQLKQFVQGLPRGYHVACKVFINEKWVLVDATWDIALKKYSFPVNLNWDGFADTLNAVNPAEEIVHNSLEERINFAKAKRALWSDADRINYAKFVEALNQWLESLRK